MCMVIFTSKRLVLVGVVLALTGCAGENPSVSISDPAVYTSAHIAAVPVALNGTSGAVVAGGEAGKAGGDGLIPFTTVTAEMARYFRQSTKSYEGSRLRLDEMLDQRQRSAGFAQIIATQLKARGTYSAGAPAPNTDANDNPATGGAAASEADVKALEDAIAAQGEDSPFDRLDRAADYYTAFLLKVLPAIGRDTRLLDPKSLQEAVEAAPQHGGVTTEALWARGTARKLRELATLREENRQRTVELRNDLPSLENNAEEKKIKHEAAERLRAIAVEQRKELVEKVKTAEKDAEERYAKDHPVKSLVYSPSVSDDPAVVAANNDLETHNDYMREQAKDLKTQSEEKAVAEASRDAARTNLLVFEEGLKEIDSQITSLTASNALPALLSAVSSTRQSSGDDEPIDRLILLTLQTHVHPGTKPNMMTGVRVRVVGATLQSDVDPNTLPQRWQVSDKAKSADWVKVIRLHPTRSYDVENQLYIEQVQQALSVSLIASGQVDASQKVSGTLDQDVREENRERRRFLSRLTKSASFADATNGEFGWNFYPTNLETRQTGFGTRLLDVITFQPPKNVEVKAYLEGGARDCAAWLLVPKELATVTLSVEHVIAPVGSANGNGREERYYWNEHGIRCRLGSDSPAWNQARTLTVTLPKWNPVEAQAFFLAIPPAGGTVAPPPPQPSPSTSGSSPSAPK